MADAASKFDQGTGEIHYYAKWSAGVGIIPVPIVDLAAVTGVQLMMLKKLADVYGVPFKKDLAKETLGALIATLFATKLGYGGVGSLIKAVPAVGTILGIVTVPAFNYASTVAVGRVFQKHFASGGTLLNFKPEAMKSELVIAYSEASASPPSSTSARARTATS